jgi:hypothetical protein
MPDAAVKEHSRCFVAAEHSSQCFGVRSANGVMYTLCGEVVRSLVHEVGWRGETLAHITALQPGR